jgi:hypothetical protein
VCGRHADPYIVMQRSFSGSHKTTNGMTEEVHDPGMMSSNSEETPFLPQVNVSQNSRQSDRSTAAALLRNPGFALGWTSQPRGPGQSNIVSDIARSAGLRSPQRTLDSGANV